MRTELLDIKLAATGLAIATVGWSKTLDSIVIPMVGVPTLVVASAFLGSLLSFAWGKPEPSRKRLFAVALTGTFLGSTIAALLPVLLGWDTAERLQGPLAGVLAFSSRHMIPPALQRARELISRFSPAGLFKDKGDDS